MVIYRVLFSYLNIHRINGELRGDPLELTLFENTGWILEEPATEGDANVSPSVVVKNRQSSHFTDESEPEIEELHICHQFTFRSQKDSLLNGCLNCTVHLTTRLSPSTDPLLSVS